MRQFDAFDPRAARIVQARTRGELKLRNGRKAVRTIGSDCGAARSPTIPLPALQPLICASRASTDQRSAMLPGLIVSPVRRLANASATLG